MLPILLNAAAIVRRTTSCHVAIAAFNERQQLKAIEIARELGWEIAGDSVAAGNSNFPTNVAAEPPHQRDARGARQLTVDIIVDRTPELMKSADACLACSGSVSMELLHHRQPTVIVYRVKRWVMLAQAFMLRTKFITLVNLIAAKDIRKRTWRPYDPDAAAVDSDPAVMPEYLTTGDPSKQVAAKVLQWWANPSQYQQKVQQLDELAQRHARPGATERAADYILSELGLGAASVDDGTSMQTGVRAAGSREVDQQVKPAA